MKAFPNPMVLTRLMLPCLTLGLGLSLQPANGQEVIQTALIISAVFFGGYQILIYSHPWTSLVDTEETQTKDVDYLDKMV